MREAGRKKPHGTCWEVFSATQAGPKRSTNEEHRVGCWGRAAAHVLRDRRDFPGVSRPVHEGAWPSGPSTRPQDGSLCCEAPLHHSPSLPRAAPLPQLLGQKATPREQEGAL